MKTLDAALRARDTRHRSPFAAIPEVAYQTFEPPPKSTSEGAIPKALGHRCELSSLEFRLPMRLSASLLRARTGPSAHASQ